MVDTSLWIAGSVAVDWFDGVVVALAGGDDDDAVEVAPWLEPPPQPADAAITSAITMPAVIRRIAVTTTGSDLHVVCLKSAALWNCDAPHLDPRLACRPAPCLYVPTARRAGQWMPKHNGWPAGLA